MVIVLGRRLCIIICLQRYRFNNEINTLEMEKTSNLNKSNYMSRIVYVSKFIRTKDALFESIESLNQPI